MGELNFGNTLRNKTSANCTGPVCRIIHRKTVSLLAQVAENQVTDQTIGCAQHGADRDTRYRVQKKARLISPRRRLEGIC